MSDDKTMLEPACSKGTIAWYTSGAPVEYRDAEDFMLSRAHQIADGTAHELVWLLEHPAIYTAGTSADRSDLLLAERFPVHKTGRGGQYTYHGPGQRIAYVMLDLRARGGADVRRFVGALQDWMIDALLQFGVRAGARPDRVGLWVPREPDNAVSDDKIAAVGIRLVRWVSLHGVSLNVDVDLAHYDGIVPCGISGHGVTSLADLGVPASMAQVDHALRESFQRTFDAKIAAAVDTDRVRVFP